METIGTLVAFVVIAALISFAEYKRSKRRTEKINSLGDRIFWRFDHHEKIIRQLEVRLQDHIKAEDMERLKVAAEIMVNTDRVTGEISPAAAQAFARIDTKNNFINQIIASDRFIARVCDKVAPRIIGSRQFEDKLNYVSTQLIGSVVDPGFITMLAKEINKTQPDNTVMDSIKEREAILSITSDTDLYSEWRKVQDNPEQYNEDPWENGQEVAMHREDYISDILDNEFGVQHMRWYQQRKGSQ